MKIIIGIFTVAVFFLLGCHYGNSILKSDNNLIQYIQNDSNQLTLSTDKKNSFEKFYYLSQDINGETGGDFYFSGNISSQIFVKGLLSVPAGAYNGIKKMCVTFNSSGIVADFTPSPIKFNKPVLYSIEYFGVDFSYINPSQVDFYYFDENANLIKIKYDKIDVDVNNGFLAVYNAQLPHFSRYGFVN